MVHLANHENSENIFDEKFRDGSDPFLGARFRRAREYRFVISSILNIECGSYGAGPPQLEIIIGYKGRGLARKIGQERNVHTKATDAIN